MKIATNIKIKKFCSCSQCSNYKNQYNQFRQNKARCFAKKRYWKDFRKKNKNSKIEDLLIPNQYMGWYFD